MSTKIWEADYNNESYYTRASLINVTDFSGIKVLSGESLVGKCPLAKIAIESESKPADYFTAGALFIVSNNLKDIIEGFAVAAEFYPVELTLNGSKFIDVKYYFLNIVEKIDCLNRELSQFTEKKGYVGDIKKLVIDEAMTVGKHLFRLGNSYQVLVLASDELSEAIKASGATGMQFLEPSEWKW